MASNKPLITFNMEPELIQRVDDYRFRNRFPSRAAAMKCLMKWALQRDPEPPAAKERVGVRG